MRSQAGLLVALALTLTPALELGAGTDPPDPASHLGFAPCADHKLATWEAIDAYLEALDAASDRMTMSEIGRSVEGRPLRLIAISSAPDGPQLSAWHQRGPLLIAVTCTTPPGNAWPANFTW